MMDMIYARWLLIRRQLPKILLWLILPLFLTLAATALFNNTSDDFRVPAAVVVHEPGAEAELFTEGLAGSEFMDVEVFEGLNSTAALRELEQYRLDSVFILPEDFERKVREGQRRNLIETYYTDRSIYYEPAKELAASVIQERMGEYGTVDYVLELQNNMLDENAVNGEEIAAERRRIETDMNLVAQQFYFHGEPVDSENEQNLNPWIVWAYITFMITIFTFDFVTRETVSGAGTRFNFMKYSYKKFAALTFILIIGVMLLIDGMTYLVINEMLSADIGLLPLITYRLILNGLALLLASFIKTPLRLYQSAVALTILLLVFQLAMPAIVSLTGIPVISSIHPVLMFTENELNIPWLIIIVILMLIWIWRDNDA